MLCVCHCSVHVMYIFLLYNAACAEVSALDSCHFLCLASVTIVTALAVGFVSQKRFSWADGKSGKEYKKKSLCCLRVVCEKVGNRI